MNTIELYNQAVGLLLPHILVIIGVLLTSIWDLFLPKLRHWTPWIAFISLLSAFWALTSQLDVNQKIFGDLYSVDPLSVVFGLIATGVGLLVVLMTTGYEHHFKTNRGEFYAILLTAIVAVMFLAGSTDLIMLFVSLETLSICCVVLAGFQKGDVKSGEASLKYLLSTAATTATLLYALSFVYGLTGATSFDGIAAKMEFSSQGLRSLLEFLIIALTLSAIGFKLSVVPFHMWTPDVYEGAPTPVTAFLSIGSKAGGFVVALRFLIQVFHSIYFDWVVVLAALAMVSMIGGNLIALAQSSFKRMLAYSSIAHVGYILIGLVAFTAEGVQAMIFYIIVYGFLNLAAFAGAILFQNETGSDRIDDMAGLIRKRPVLAILMSIALLNLAGLPIPPAGFFAKVFIFKAGLEGNQFLTDPTAQNAMLQHTALNNLNLGWWLVAVALVTSIPAIYYYCRVIIKMIVPEPSEKVAQLPASRAFVGSPQEGTWVALLACSVAIFAAGTFLVDPIVSVSRKAAEVIDPQKVKQMTLERKRQERLIGSNKVRIISANPTDETSLGNLRSISDAAGNTDTLRTIGDAAGNSQAAIKKNSGRSSSIKSKEVPSVRDAKYVGSAISSVVN
jgi:NAD(P)H-quinone oxidoreductase subunit 2